jgi:hypothetical protein
MNQTSYHAYLKKYYRIRQIINYSITPLCIALYSIGFYFLLPYFKEIFSEGFYIYIIISGVISIIVVRTIIIYSIKKEQRFLEYLNER